MRCHGCAALVQQNRLYIALPTRVPSAEGAGEQQELLVRKLVLVPQARQPRGARLVRVEGVVVGGRLLSPLFSTYTYQSPWSAATRH